MILAEERRSGIIVCAAGMEPVQRFDMGNVWGKIMAPPLKGRGMFYNIDSMLIQ